MNKVLIIEDEIDTAQAVKDGLELENISADIAYGGKEGLQKLKNLNYDLVLLDLKMPGMSGEEVLTEIRHFDPFIDVIIYTNYSDFADIKKLANIGIDGYINKGPNADLDELLEIIKNKLAPLDEDEIKSLISNTPKNLFD